VAPGVCVSACCPSLGAVHRHRLRQLSGEWLMPPLNGRSSSVSHVLILVGSTNEGINTALADAATSFLSDAGHRVTRYPSLSNLPHYHQGFDESGIDANIDDFRAAVKDSDAVLFVTPEYNGGPSSLIKNALDAASRPRLKGVIHQKPSAVIGASPSPGGAAGGREAASRRSSSLGRQTVGGIFRSGFGARKNRRTGVWRRRSGAAVHPLERTGRCQ